MRIMILGSGYVGLVTGVCLAEFGFKVTCVDIDEEKIQKLQQGILPIYEPGLQVLLQKNLATLHVQFSTDVLSNITVADLILIAIGTPSTSQGSVDLSFITQALHAIAPHLQKYTPIVIKSTVPPGTCRALKQQILLVNPHAQFDIISNPEFLREGVAVRDFMQPDRVVIGLDNLQNRDIMAKLYKPLQAQHVPIVYTTLETAELIKYASNALLATKIAFINEMADLCESIGADVQVLSQAVGLDQRIGPQFLQPGPGFGGSCFPKDTLGLQNFAASVDVPVRIVDAVITANQQRKSSCVRKIIAACGGNISGKEFAVLGVAFKANTDDIRESPAVEIIMGLLAAGAKLRLFDPAALPNARVLFGDHDNIRYAGSLKESLCNANAVLILTEWQDFKTLKLNEVANLISTFDKNMPKLMLDMRNLFNPHDFVGLNMRYVSLGRPVYDANHLNVNIHEY